MMQWNEGIAKISVPTPYQVGDVNVFVVKGDALTLIDTGIKSSRSMEVLDQRLHELGLRLQDIEQVVLTHHHPDHSGGLDFFDESIPVLGHRLNQRFLAISEEFINHHDQFFREFAGVLGVPEEYTPMISQFRKTAKYIGQRHLKTNLSEGDTIPGLVDWTVIETPGHAQSHISIYREKDGVMIGGDHLLERISPNPLMEPPVHKGEPRPKPLLQYNASLKKWLDYPISTVYTGHGNELNNVPSLIGQRFAKQHERAMHVKRMILDRPATGFEICRQLFPKVYDKELGLTLSETVGQLDYLEDLGEIKREESSGAIIYFAQ
ncbi:MBL fold metallo-hydrolase [Peribacillus sp. SCS-155]|uniref:MBL fold metallo-hydrolase n=1 Tax=Peribacillus sedimenti TaxID=3115297 RepID=UPI003906AD84